MGNIFQKHLPENEAPSPSVALLTGKEVDIIKETWKIPSANVHDSAELIFYTYLERFPHNQEKFVAFKDTPLAQLKVSSLWPLDNDFNHLKEIILEGDANVQSSRVSDLQRLQHRH